MKARLLFTIIIATQALCGFSQGNVGVGETSPGSKFSVNGNLAVGGSYSTTAAPNNGAIIQGKAGIGTSAPDTSAVLDITSTTGGLLPPRMTAVQRNAIVTPANGLIVFDTDSGSLYYYNSGWYKIINTSNPTGMAGGDLSGSYPNPVLAQVNGASVPAAGSLSTGNVLQVNGSSSLTYGALNLAGGSSYVSGTLPVANGGTGTGTAFTAGSVVFAGSGGTYSQDNTNLFWDATNHRLGIGINSPALPLHVLGDAMFGSGTNTYYSSPAGSGAITLNGNTSGAMLRMVMNDGSGTFNQYQNAYYDGSNWKYNASAAATKFTSSSGTLSLQVAVSGTAGANVSWKNGIFIDNSANVGIGTASPASALSVGSSNQFQVNSSGNIVKINNVVTSFPSSQGSTGQVLTNSDGAGTLTWATPGAGSGSLLNVRTLTSGTSYTPTSGTSKIMIMMVGGGGAGGGANVTGNDQISVGGGGGAGGYVQKYITSIGAGPYTYSIGTGGTGSASAAGGDGGNTTITIGATTYTAGGGSGGSYMQVTAAAHTALAGGDGGTATNGDINAYGQPGGYTINRQNINEYYIAGAGGSTNFGGGGSAIVQTPSGTGNIATAGDPGHGYGSGGGGAFAQRHNANESAAGGAGAQGVIVIYEYQ